jgi:two-component system, LuxR family, response regulator FixJ
MSADVVIHIVDDEEPVRKSLAFLLTMSDHAVRVHESATHSSPSRPVWPTPAW